MTGSTCASNISRTRNGALSSRRRARARRAWWRSSTAVLLALDTSTDWASVALFDGRDVLGEETWRAQRRQGDELFPAIERILLSTRTALSAVTRVAVATGPGSFTGLRVAIAAGQGIARGSGAALVGISTLDVLAYPHAPSKLRTCPLLPAGRDQYYAAFYQERNRKWMRRSPFIVASLAEICRQIGTHTLFVGEVDPDAEQVLRDLLGPKALFASPASRVRRAGFLAELGWKELEASPQVSQIEPLYVRQPSIRVSFDQPFAPPPADERALGLPKRD
ncbi:MAG: tRNA (adenosine(37)-N6)-threonylcarbamoyltransferase complex dimerization subunit type 1 TsaB [Chloroflexi bacterium]|nr:MAG: tRNA (adenosine(37)-N6)-threonylcarbamoyltransferase complex dimerization subunit type 1 TsaB [Chloroflexota bacterium]